MLRPAASGAGLGQLWARRGGVPGQGTFHDPAIPFSACHVMGQPTLGFWSGGGGEPVSSASRASRSKRPLTGIRLFGRASSKAP